MNLLEMATAVCSRVRQSDPASIVKCKTFIRHWFEISWNDALWKDALGILDIPWTAGMSRTFGTVQWGAAAFGTEGQLLLPAWVDRVVALRIDAMRLNVVNELEFYQQDFNIYNNTGTPSQFVILSPVASLGYGLATGYALANANYRMRYFETYLKEILEITGAITDSTNPTVDNVGFIESFTCDSIAAAPYFLFGTDARCKIALGDSAAPIRPRIRILPTPTMDQTFRVLLKRKCPTMLNDTDVFPLRGIEPALIHFAEADMYQQQKKASLQQQSMTEAAGLLGKLKEQCVFQEATRTRVIPDVEPESAFAVGVGFATKGSW